jgi:hypothetical protein
MHLEGIGKLKDTITQSGLEHPDVSAYIIAPQPTTLSRAPCVT